MDPWSPCSSFSEAVRHQPGMGNQHTPFVPDKIGSGEHSVDSGPAGNKVAQLSNVEVKVPAT